MTVPKPKTPVFSGRFFGWLSFFWMAFLEVTTLAASPNGSWHYYGWIHHVAMTTPHSGTLAEGGVLNKKDV